MKLTNEAISKYQSRIDGLDQYNIIIREIEDNKMMNPDISIDSCKSIIEGLCKKALSLISDDYINKKSIRKDCEKFDKLLAHTFKKVFKESFEADLLKSFSNIIYAKSRTNQLLKKSFDFTKQNTINSVNAIVKLRDTRGDISHGRVYPKLTSTSIHLLNSIVSITDSICSFLVIEMSLRYFEKLEFENKVNELKDYRSNSGFNQWLNNGLVSEFPVKKVTYSRVLFDNDFDLYQEIYYDEYYPNLNILESKEVNSLSDIINDLLFFAENNGVSIIKEEIGVISEVEVISETELISEAEVVSVDELDDKIEEFTLKNNFDTKAFKELLEDILFTDKVPLREEIFKIPNYKVNLSDRSSEVANIIIKINNFIESIKS